MSSRFSIPNPCHKTWNDLQGDGRKRFCEECRTPVYARESYSDEEWDRIWSDSGGHVCGMLGGESLPAPRTRRAILAGALLTAISPLMAQSGRLRVRVINSAGLVLAGAEVSLLGTDGKALQVVRSDQAGEAAFSGLVIGECTLSVSASGFKRLTLIAIIGGIRETRIDARLDMMVVGDFSYVPQPAGGKVRLHVTDAAGTRIKGFQAVVLGWDGKPTRTFVAGDAGEVEIKELPLGPVQIDVRTTGFKTQRLTLMIRAGEDVTAETSLELGTVGTFIQVGPPTIGNARIHVTDRTGAAIELFQASVRELDSQRTPGIQTGIRGEIALKDLPLGQVHIAIWATGFATTLLPLTLKNEREVKADVVLEPGTSDKVIQAKPQ